MNDGEPCWCVYVCVGERRGGVVVWKVACTLGYSLLLLLL